MATAGGAQAVDMIGLDLIATHGGVITPVNLGGHSEGTVFDLQQNIAGWCRFTAVGKRGMSIMVRYTETLTLTDNPQVDGSLYSENLRNAASTDIFIFSKDDEPETFEPPFTQHGFPLHRVPRPEARDGRQRRHLLLRPQRDHAGGQLHVQLGRHEPDTAQRALGTAVQRHVAAHRLRPARREEGLDGRRRPDSGRGAVQLRSRSLLRELPKPHTRHTGQQRRRTRHRALDVRQQTSRPELSPTHHTAHRTATAPGMRMV